MKMYALKTIVRGDEVIKPKTVFESKGKEADDLRDIKAARPATVEEIQDAETAQAIANGQVVPPAAATVNSAVPMPPSGAIGDPNSTPKGA